MWRSLLLAAMLTTSCLAGSPNVFAQDSRTYGARGRTILNVGVGAIASNRSHPVDPLHDSKWSAGMGLTWMQFVANNFALGGSLSAGADRRVGPYESPSTIWTTGSVDAAFHVPLSRSLSLRFWVWSGLRSGWYTFESVSGQPLPRPRARYRELAWVAGVQPALLVHLSPSVALTFGPSVIVSYDPDDGANVGLRLDNGLSYSFGPHQDETRGTTRLDAAENFSRRGRNVLSGGITVGMWVTGFVGYARFVRDRLALGGYVTADVQEYPLGDASFGVGAGAQLVVDLPFARSLSVLMPVRLGYRWDGTDSPLGDVRYHELIASLPVMLGVHLNERLTLGIGPTGALHLKLHHSSSSEIASRGPQRVYLSGGLGSMLVASF